MMRRLQDGRPTAFDEAGAVVRLPTIFRIERTRVGHAGTGRSPMQKPHLPLSQLPEPFRHARTESQKNTQNP
jgi:hypothetical protein